MNDVPTLTEAQQRALRALARVTGDGTDIYPRMFAQELYAGSIGYTRRTLGRGASKFNGAHAGTMPMLAAKMLRKLVSLGLADERVTDRGQWFYKVNARGRETIAALDAAIEDVGSGVCHCGSDMADHGLFSDHTPVELMVTDPHTNESL